MIFGNIARQILLSTPVVKSARVLQMSGMFDVPPAERSVVELHVDMPLGDRDWNIGLITGPSGCGKSSLARKLWPEEYTASWNFEWSESKSVLDDFPASMSVRDIVELLSSVGFSSPPLWLRRYGVLSTGEKFRVEMARLLAEQPEFAVIDEFTSVVDRTVAQIGSAAIAKTIRRRGQKLVAVTCHDDVLDWLQPDWVYRPAEQRFEWRYLQPRPSIELEIRRVHHSAWSLFRQYHYLDSALNQSAVCFCAFWRGRPVAFTAWLSHPSYKNMRRFSRVVVLPDYQGAGIGGAISDTCASLFKATGARVVTTASHPAILAAWRRSGKWVQTRSGFSPKVGRAMQEKNVRSASTRLTSSFEYVGPAASANLARELLSEKMTA